MKSGRLLRRQLLRHLGTTEVPPGPLADFVVAIDRAYAEADADRALLERSLELTSRELLERNQELRALSDALADLARELAHDWGDRDVPLRRITERVAAVLDVDRVSVWVIGDDGAQCVDTYGRRDTLHRTGANAEPIERVPYLDQFRGKRLLAITDSATMAPSGVRAALVAACWVGGRLVGLVTIEHTGGARTWSPVEQGFAGSIADLVSLVIEGHLRRAAEEARAKLETSLIEAQRLESIGQLAGGVAHDFNNLLTPILYAAHSIRHDAPTPAEVVELAGEILDAAASARDLTAQLLAVGRKQVMELRPVVLNDEIHHAARFLARVIPESIAFELHLDPRLGSTRADPGQLRQVLTNLAINARDAMPNGGTLTITTRNHGDPVRPLVVLEVRDTGQGMSPQTMTRIFDPFFTTKELGRGTGLGLSMVYGIVHQHGGSIDVRSEEGTGTTFEVSLLRIADPRADDDPRVEVPPPPHLTMPVKATILVVDDEDAVRRVVCRILDRNGYDVVEAACVDDAIALADRGAKIDLIVTDVVMPRGNGRDLAARLPQCAVVYMSGYSREFLGASGSLDPGVTLLRKPFTPAELLRAVRERSHATIRDADA